MDKDLLKKRHIKRLDSLANQSSEDKAFFMSAPDILVYFDHKESKPVSDDKQKQVELPNEPVDSWVLLAACIVFNMLMGYHFLCFGMYYVQITETFETTKAGAGFIISLQGAIGPLSGLVTSALITRYGERRVAMVGSCISVAGIFSSSFAPNVYFLYISYGAVTGIGITCSMLGLSVSIQKHFNKHRSMATTLVYCGIPLGNLFSPMITNYFLDTYGLRGTFMLHSGIMLNTVVLAGTFWPVGKQQSNKTEIQPKDIGKKSVTNSGICDFSLCKNYLFIFFAMSVVLIRFNSAAFMDHTPSRTVNMGYGLKWAGLLISILCGASLIVRLTCSVVTLFVKNINSLLILAICATVQGVTSCLVPLAASSYYLLALCSVSFGAAQGIIIPMMMLSTVQLAGVQRFGTARALTNLFSALSNFTATPLTGFIFDRTQNYDLPFYISGTVALIGSLIAYTTAIIHHCKSSKNNAIDHRKPETMDELTSEFRIRTITY